MPIVDLFLILAVVGVLVWAICSFLPMEPAIKKILVITACIICVIYVLQATGFLGAASHIKVPKIG